MDFLKLTHDVLSVDDIMKKVSSEKCGAVSIFVGTTRNNFEGKEVIHLEYEAYDTMALKVMKNLCTEIRNKWSDTQHIAIYHRLGIVPVMEASVVIAISSPHRVDSLAAVQYCIENLKDNKFPLLIDETNNQNKIIDHSLNTQLIQVNASNEEIERRIRNFIDRKRDQINLWNIEDFIKNKEGFQESNENVKTSCARVDAVLVKRKDSKGHVKVMRVNNEWGPQTVVEKAVVKSTSNRNFPSSHNNNGVEERISNAEKHLNIIQPVSSDIYVRLKQIENRILELESLSPEYVTFWTRKSHSSSQENENRFDGPSPKKVKYSADEIKRKMEALERQ